jgi:multidrug resistance efflux pump
MDTDPLLHAVHHAYHELQKAKHRMSVSQGQFDTDLAAYIAADAAYQTAVGVYIAAVQTAAPNLATEDSEVAAALANVNTAQAALVAAKP